jgi:uncharacterized membrane protein
LILTGIALAGALIRIYFVERHKGRASLAPVAVAVLILAAIFFGIAPRPQVSSSDEVAFEQVRNVINARCRSCHSSEPVHPAFPAAPLGVVLDTDAQIVAEALRIHQQTVVTRVMPIGNLTSMTDDEREIIDRWYLGLQVD